MSTQAGTQWFASQRAPVRHAPQSSPSTCPHSASPQCCFVQTASAHATHVSLTQLSDVHCKLWLHGWPFSARLQLVAQRACGSAPLKQQTWDTHSAFSLHVSPVALGGGWQAPPTHTLPEAQSRFVSHFDTHTACEQA